MIFRDTEQDSRVNILFTGKAFSLLKTTFNFFINFCKKV